MVEKEFGFEYNINSTLYYKFISQVNYTNFFLTNFYILFDFSFSFEEVIA